MRRALHHLALVAAAVIASLGVAQADARMTVLYDIESSVDALTDPARPDALDPGFDGLHQQSIAPRGNEFPEADPANPRDGSRFVAKIVGRPPPASGNCSNTYLTDTGGVPLAPEAIAGLLRDGAGRVESAGCVDNDPPAPDQVGVGTFASRMVFVEEVSGARWQSASPGSLAEAFLGAITQLDAEAAPADIPDGSGYEPAPTMAEHVHVYLRFPQTLTVFPERWTDLRATLPLLGGVWLEAYGYGGEERRAWDEARYATLLRPFARDHLSAGGDLRRLHLLMGATVRPEVQDPGRTAGDQWPWARAGAACEILRNGPGGYRLGDGPIPDPWGEFGTGFRETFRGAADELLPAGAPPDLAPSPIACVPAHRLTETTQPTAGQFAEVVALLGRGSIELPDGAVGQLASGGDLTVDVAAGLPAWLDRGFAARSGAVVGATGGGTTTQARVDPDGVARVPAPGTDPAGVTLQISGIRGEMLLDAARGDDGRVPDPHLSLLCAGSRLPGEQVPGPCADVISGTPGREWIPAGDAFRWLLASTTLLAPVAALIEADPDPPGETPPAATPPADPAPPAPTASPPATGTVVPPACSTPRGLARSLCLARDRRAAAIRACRVRAGTAGTRRTLCEARARAAYIRAAARVRRAAALAACRTRTGTALIRCRRRVNAGYRVQLATATRTTQLAACARRPGARRAACRARAILAFRRAAAANRGR